MVYVTNSHEETVIPVRAASNTALAPITVGRDARAIAITPDGKTAYLINYGPVPRGPVPRGPGTVTPVRLATGTVLPPIKVGPYPSAIAITPR